MNSADWFVENLISNFDFKRVHDVMEFLNWTWVNCNGEQYIPNEVQLSSQCTKMIYECYKLALEAQLNEPFFYKTGGIEVSACLAEDKKSIVFRYQNY